MLPRPLRLTRQGFSNTRGLKRVHSAHFSLSYGNAETEGLGGSGVIVPKKVVKGSVDRHLLKRRLRAFLLPYSTPSRIFIVSARAKADTLSYKDLEHELSVLIGSIIQNT
ncbi:MAG: Ribonuclease protein component [Parcubacteria group bacterium]|nr:Ribonuclease protein component [Parcubacteria group bacterium]